MRIIVTGGAGFIGSHLMDAFDAAGLDEHVAFAVDNFLTGRESNYHLIADLDICDRSEFYAFANEIRPELIVHCAASYSDPDKWHRDTDTNVAGCINAALVAKHHGAHLIYFQTILPPISSYAISKIAGEQYLRLSGIPLTVLRLANIYGPRNLSGPIPTFYKRLTEGLPVTAVKTTRDMVYIDDLVRAVQMVVQHELTGTFDVCTGVQTPIHELLENVCKAVYGGNNIIFESVDPLDDDVQGTVDPENGIPLWSPVMPLPTGIARTVKSYQENGVDKTHTHLKIGATDAS
jgi:UDP-glucose 4-epimerase